MICVAISDKSIEKCLAILDVVDMAEIRLDLTDFGIEEINRIFAHPTPQVATCRPEKKGPQDQLKRLIAAIRAGVSSKLWYEIITLHLYSRAVSIMVSRCFLLASTSSSYLQT